MKYNLVITALCLGVINSVCFGNSLPTQKIEEERQVAVFVNSDKTVTVPLNALRAKLTASLINEDYIVVDRTEQIMDLLKKEYSYQAGGLVRDDQLISIGDHIGASYICSVTVTFFEAYQQFFFECKIVNVKTRQIEKQSYFPDTDKKQSVVNTLTPQEQIRVAETLSKELSFNQKQLKIGDAYYEDHAPVYVQGVLMRIGYIDETGNHGFAYVVLPKKSDSPTWSTDADKIQLQIPTISQLELLYQSKDILGLNDEYWSSERLDKRYDSSYHHFSFDFSTGSINDRWSSKRVESNMGANASISSQVVRIHKNVKTGNTYQTELPFHNDYLSCINIHFF